MSTREQVLEILQELLSRRDRPSPPISDASALYEIDLALDSLEVAEFSAQLELRLGRDPFTDGELPQTVGQVVSYYNQSP